MQIYVKSIFFFTNLISCVVEKKMITTVYTVKHGYIKFASNEFTLTAK